MPVNTEYLSTGTTVLSNLSLNSPSDASLRVAGVRAATGNFTSALTATAVTLTGAVTIPGTATYTGSLVATGAIFSSKTLAVSGITNGASIASNELILTVGASGSSLVLRSGNTLWIWGSTVSAAATG